MKKNYIFVAILIIAILIATVRFVGLSYALSFNTSEDDSYLFILRDNSIRRYPIEFELMLLLALLLGEIFLLCISLYRLIATDFIADSYLFDNVIFIRPPPADLSFAD